MSRGDSPGPGGTPLFFCHPLPQFGDMRAGFIACWHV
jgi:hypothetical protein